MNRTHTGTLGGCNNLNFQELTREYEFLNAYNIESGLGLFELSTAVNEW